ncbi:hypothetical protein SPF06_12395 [Sinomonas sp. JGH33]|uniref:Translation initiation factor IF-2 n=1 Tax=Sinomonas terricola TaxID=3110330 RepID=A0ABU5T7K6_9MICC|nr:hypothetical protein [Sinomonas sp. JGH33]MEA5455525.1 hypothetical protein [Sinomonas sp. JGH33]
MPDRTELERTSESERTAVYARGAAPTESFEAASAAEPAAPGWGAPAWGAPQPTAANDGDAPAAVGHPAAVPAEEYAAQGYGAPEDDEPFVPAPRYRMTRFTKLLVCACLVLAGALGGAAIQKVVDTGNGTRGNVSQFVPGTGTGGTGGAGGTGGFGRNRASQSPGATAPASPGASAPAAGGN